MCLTTTTWVRYISSLFSLAQRFSGLFFASVSHPITFPFCARSLFIHSALWLRSIHSFASFAASSVSAWVCACALVATEPPQILPVAVTLCRSAPHTKRLFIIIYTVAVVAVVGRCCRFIVIIVLPFKTFLFICMLINSWGRKYFFFGVVKQSFTLFNSHII